MQSLKLFLTTSLLTLAFVLAGKSSAQTVTTLFSFNVATGQYPDLVILTQGRDGALYGTTRMGGTQGIGTVFRQETDGTNTTLFNFSSTNGTLPAGGVILARDGNFYGTTGGGGSVNAGVLFKITPAGVFTVLYNFGTGAGSQPTSPPIKGLDGNLYGTTNFSSTVYKYDWSSGTVSLLYTASKHGFSFFAPPLQTPDGNLYITANLGAKGFGSVIKLTTAGVYLGSSSFTGGTTEGAYPIGPVMQTTDGRIFGTTWIGGTYNQGTIYELTSGGIKTVHSFGGATDGSYLVAGLTQGSDGNLYGISGAGGTFGAGVLFQYKLDGTYTKLYDFPLPSQGAGAAPIQHTNGFFYGVTTDGGSNSLGQVYQLDQGLGPFVTFAPAHGRIGSQAHILGQGFTGSTSVTFNGMPANFSVVSDTYLTATVPRGAITGPVVVTTPTGALTSNVSFRVTK